MKKVPSFIVITLNEPVQRRLCINDSSHEKIGELLNENPSGLLKRRDELSGWLAQMQQEAFQTSRAFYLECFNGNGAFTFDRIQRGTVHIQNCCLSIVGGIQPSKLAPIVRGAVLGTNDDGLLQRFQLAVWPDDITDQRYVDMLPDVKAKANYDAVFHRLASIPFDPDIGPRVYQFNPEAQSLFISWYNSHLKQCSDPDLLPSLESHISKMRKTVPSLALVFALVKGEEKLVDFDSLTMAISWCNYLVTHAKRIYSIAANGDVDGAKLILSRRHKLNSCFKARDVIRKQWSGLTENEIVYGSLALLKDHNYLQVTQIGNGKGGRPTNQYSWNSQISDHVA